MLGKEDTKFHFNTCDINKNSVINHKTGIIYIGYVRRDSLWVESKKSMWLEYGYLHWNFSRLKY